MTLEAWSETFEDGHITGFFISRADCPKGKVRVTGQDAYGVKLIGEFDENRVKGGKLEARVCRARPSNGAVVYPLGGNFRAVIPGQTPPRLVTEGLSLNRPNYEVPKKL